jgi:hypothetical protein
MLEILDVGPTKLARKVGGFGTSPAYARLD